MLCVPILMGKAARTLMCHLFVGSSGEQQYPNTALMCDFVEQVGNL